MNRDDGNLDERMDPIYLDLFRGQMGRECKFALKAVDEIKEALNLIDEAKKDTDRQGLWNQEKMARGVDRFWYSVEAFLRATANLSKVFWPPVARSKSLRPQTAKRGKQLRRILEISDESPLRNRILRDHFEHFDERLDDWYQSERWHGDFAIIDSNLFERRYLAKSKGYLRNFDPTEWILLFAGDELELKPVIAEVKSLQQKVERPLVDWGI